MSKFYLAYLSLGSNIEPDVNLPRALQLISEHGENLKISSVWVSEPVGTTGANYLNVCLLFKSRHSKESLKDAVIQSVEMQLGRRRSHDKFAPRTIDIDIVLFDNEPVSAEWLTLAYVVVPLAEIYPKFQNPLTKEKIVETATRLRREVWMEARRGVLG